MKEYSEFMKEIIIEAGILTQKYFGINKAKYTKEHEQDFVTESDLKSNELISNAIKKKFPDHGIISEEEPNYQVDAKYVWVIDPIDGTWNYAKHIPMYSILIALMKNEEVVMGAVYFPTTKDLYFAQKDKGATLNGEKIRCSEKQELKHSVGLGHHYKKNDFIVPKITELSKSVPIYMNQLFCMGYHAAYTADGKYDWLISPGGKLWDYAASYILLKEAGCKVTHLNGDEWTIKGEGLVAANPKLHKIIKGL